jgi:hypothetical protein
MVSEPLVVYSRWLLPSLMTAFMRNCLHLLMAEECKEGGLREVGGSVERGAWLCAPLTADHLCFCATDEDAVIMEFVHEIW